jgi:hypothetical protein
VDDCELLFGVEKFVEEVRGYRAEHLQGYYRDKDDVYDDDSDNDRRAFRIAWLFLLRSFWFAGLAGFAGFVEVFGTKYRYSSNMIASSGYAWTGLMASLVGQYNPFAILFYSIFFSGLTIGGQALQRDFGIPLQIADIITSSIMLFVSINIGIHLFKAGRKQRTEKKEETGNKTPAKEAA